MRTKLLVITGLGLIVISSAVVFYLILNTAVPIYKSTNTIAYFPETNFDLGIIETGKSMQIVIPFENQGENGLKIYNIVPECGCSVPEWPLRPIPSGAKDSIRVTFTPSGTGYFKKSLSIFANNIDGPIIISLSGSSK